MAFKRLGKYTGRIYEFEDLPNVQECAMIISDLETEAQLEYLRSRNRISCLFCTPGPSCCPEKMKAIENGG